MGNRAVITDKNKKFGIYVHWNGGRDSIEGFLEAARRLEFRTPEEDASYAFARLTGIICAFFGLGDSTSVGIGPLDELDTDNGDNGVYVVGDDWRVVERYGSGAPANAVKDPNSEKYDKGSAKTIADDIVAKAKPDRAF